MLPVQGDRSYVALVLVRIALVLLLAQPPSEGEDEAEGVGPVEGPSEAQPATDEPPPATQQPPPTTVEPPPPGISGPPPTVEFQPQPEPPRTQPHHNEPEPDPEIDTDEFVRDRADMPLAPTAARKSAVRRNNEVLVRPFRRPLYSVMAAARFGTLFSSGADLVQPFGYGFAAHLRIHFLPVLKSRVGVEIHAGHTRFPKRVEFDDGDGDKVARKALLTDTDFSAGPSWEIPIGPVFFGFGGSAGVALSSLFRPLSIEGAGDELVSTTNFMLRGGLSLGIPVLNHHGLNIGAGVHHVFSPRRVAIDPTTTGGPTVRPFGTMLEVALGYQIWF
jgi:hypothetical protein